MKQSAAVREEQNAMDPVSLEIAEITRKIQAILDAGKGVLLTLDDDGNIVTVSLTEEEVI